MYLLISGPSCSGKTSLAAKLLKGETASAFFEPTSTSRYYPLFLGDMARYAFKNQIDFMRISFHQERAIAAAKAGLVVQDAGLLVCHHVYSAYFRDRGYLSPQEYEALERYYQRKIKRCSLPDAVIHLTADIPVLEARAIRRDSKLIHSFPEIMPYWDRLVEVFRKNGIPCLVIDTGGAEIEEIGARAIKWLEELKN